MLEAELKFLDVTNDSLKVDVWLIINKLVNQLPYTAKCGEVFYGLKKHDDDEKSKRSLTDY